MIAAPLADRAAVALAPRSAFRRAPKIVLVKCWLCAGEGVLRLHFTKPGHVEPCAVCTGGTIVRDNA